MPVLAIIKEYNIANLRNFAACISNFYQLVPLLANCLVY